MASKSSPFKSSKSLSLFISFIFLQFTMIAARGPSYNDYGATVADLHSRDLISVKIWIAIIFLITTFAGGIFPYFLRRNETFLLLGTQFAGGIFLATALVHFLGDSGAIFYEYMESDFPFMSLLGLIGYLIAMFANCFVTKYCKKSEEVGDVEQAGIDLNSGFTKTSPIGDTILLVFALCFHSAFEGIAVGVTGRKRYAWTYMWTTLLHQIPLAIAMVITLLKMKPKRALLLTLNYSIAYAISSPVGVGIGIAIDAPTQGEGGDWTYAITIGIASGFLIYVAINHLIAKGFRPQRKLKFDSPFYKFLAVFVGVVLISIASIFGD